ncbi:MAG: gluconate 2-dehydrogenase subunit 3 family protein [Ornithinimicrobium sp.]
MTETFFDASQRGTIAAAMARIIPTDEHAGATEAGCIDFLERYLSGTGHVYAKPDGSGFETLHGKREQAWRHRIEVVRRTYLRGVRELDERAQSVARTVFADLSPEQQDSVLHDMETGLTSQGAEVRPNLAYGGPVEPALQQTNAEVDLDFFSLLVLHTRQGFYADPIYGGNRDQVGWQLIGFPGPDSLAHVHNGTYSTLEWFATERAHPRTEA